jgi:hypothetical protein
MESEVNRIASSLHQLAAEVEVYRDMLKLTPTATSHDLLLLDEWTGRLRAESHNLFTLKPAKTATKKTADSAERECPYCGQ